MRRVTVAVTGPAALADRAATSANYCAGRRAFFWDFSIAQCDAVCRLAGI